LSVFLQGMKKIAILASGNGSNAENLIKFFKNSDCAQVSYVICNKKEAGIYDRCKNLNIPCHYFTNQSFDTGEVQKFMINEKTDLIVLAGFLHLIPKAMVQHFQGKMVNIHPSLLPAFGGKGMYGMKVHQAVIASGATESGITIHLVNENFDEGEILFRAHVSIEAGDDAVKLQSNIAKLEMQYYPEIVEKLCRQLS